MLFQDIISDKITKAKLLKISLNFREWCVFYIFISRVTLMSGKIMQELYCQDCSYKGLFKTSGNKVALSYFDTQ